VNLCDWCAEMYLLTLSNVFILIFVIIIIITLCKDVQKYACHRQINPLMPNLV
jgi:hypothetical protein